MQPTAPPDAYIALEDTPQWREARSPGKGTTFPRMPCGLLLRAFDESEGVFKIKECQSLDECR